MSKRFPLQTSLSVRSQGASDESGGLLLGSSKPESTVLGRLPPATAQRGGYCVDEAQEQNRQHSEAQNPGAFHVQQSGETADGRSVFSAALTSPSQAAEVAGEEEERGDKGGSTGSQAQAAPVLAELTVCPSHAVSREARQWLPVS